ncbi:hypothetical protein ASPFODRAFT_47504 [Aspergillus luchuensis CBS 106.47]|uniref:Uncharacterized protein n=1 Tax=Aspergillus luchuensis (strain CBS 106.47) TaxID=1137211 RepID=A0A1M3TDW5_ASPLC|nr:hypothetical protein ASPFODRAFT_47504 [Aspergillus luchuensis CBS 106.47]
MREWPSVGHAKTSLVVGSQDRRWPRSFGDYLAGGFLEDCQSIGYSPERPKQYTSGSRKMKITGLRCGGSHWRTMAVSETGLGDAGT